MADRLEIVDALQSLETHCRPPLMDVEARARWVRDWCEDLKDFPVESVRMACTRWRQGDSLKFPTPGQLLPIVRSLTTLHKNAGAEKAAQPWTWPCEAELEGMTLAEKRRQYQIMAHESRAKAGPMNADGTHPRPEWIEKARAYSEEAQRIAGHIARGAQRRLDAAE